jgi:glycosyltransferase involved in cell wall biosynthesis
VRDIEPKGFRLLTMDGFVTPSIAKRVEQILHDPELREEIVNHNYEVARQFYSYSTVRGNLRAFIASLTGY